jgi:DUF4097 and DUF4098 domain-containing protein YvlB
MRPIPLLLAAILTATLFTLGCDPADFGPSDRFQADFHYTLKPADRLSVENFNGEIEITGWDQPSIEVTGMKYASTEETLNRIRIDVHESPALTEIRTSRPEVFHGNQGARFLIRVPRKTIVDRIVSSNGAIRVENVSGGVNAETSNGAIDLDAVSGKLSLRTSNGRIRAEDVDGQCDARTSNGPVTLGFRTAPDGPALIKTSNGPVDVTMSQSPKNDLTVETSNGSITLDLPGSAAARLNAETSRSSISSEFDVSGTFEPHNQKHHLEGTIGAGGPHIELTTRNGGIHLRKSSVSSN